LLIKLLLFDGRSLRGCGHPYLRRFQVGRKARAVS
jgi:hypothetical protein